MRDLLVVLCAVVPAVVVSSVVSCLTVLLLRGVL
ncbi:hypothetical protein VB1_CDS0073 [Arthrobacter phage Marchesin]|nr:hypothetical protein VB1_CDS0073 [Arthrobacter phage Marchesin]